MLLNSGVVLRRVVVSFGLLLGIVGRLGLSSPRCCADWRL